MSEIVHIENLEKTYVSSGETLTVLKALDLSVEEGSKTVITGESGCGKSTLLNIIGAQADGISLLSTKAIRPNTVRIFSDSYFSFIIC